MNSQMFIVARRPVRLRARQKSALSATGRDCSAPKQYPGRFAVRGFALPDCCARHRSPPTARHDEDVNISAFIARSTLHGSGFRSYVRGSDIQIIKVRILLAHRRHHLCAIAVHQVATEPSMLNASNAVHTVAYSKRFLTPHRTAVRDTVIQLAGAAALCCQGCARGRQCGSHSPPPLTAAAFRLSWRLGSGFGKRKAGAFVSHVEIIGQAAIESKARRLEIAQSLIFNPEDAFRASGQFDAVLNPMVFLFAFWVVFRASSKVRPNLCGRVVLAGVAGQVSGLMSSRAGRAHRDCLPLVTSRNNRFLFRSLPPSLCCRSLLVPFPNFGIVQK